MEEMTVGDKAGMDLVDLVWAFEEALEEFQ